MRCSYCDGETDYCVVCRSAYCTEEGTMCERCGKAHGIW